jgi:hypothetical protein
METVSKYALIYFRLLKALFLSNNVAAFRFCHEANRQTETTLTLHAERKHLLKIPIGMPDHELRAQCALRMGVAPDLLAGIYCMACMLVERDRGSSSNSICNANGACKVYCRSVEERESATISCRDRITVLSTCLVI